MQIEQVAGIAGALIFRPTPHVDERGFFSRTFDRDVVKQAGLDPDAFVQDSISRSRRGVVRGMHIRAGAGEAKLVRCSYGAVLDVVVDLRPDSPTYRQRETFDLTGENQVTVYVPAGCAHGFQALADGSELLYQHTGPYTPDCEDGVRYDDPHLAIRWPLPATCVSARDLAFRSLDAAFERMHA